MEKRKSKILETTPMNKTCYFLGAEEQKARLGNREGQGISF